MGGAVDYKIFHHNNSYPIPTPNGSSIQWRYPYADIYIFRKKDTCKNLISYEKCHGFSSDVTWPNGTKLVDFADFQIRISGENKEYLDKYYSESWKLLGKTHWYDHYHQRPHEYHVKKFLIPPLLSSPATPFYIPSYLKNCDCKNYL